MGASAEVDVLVVSVGGTGGWRSSADELEAGLRRAGASTARAHVDRVRRVRTFMLTDLTQALSARQAARRAIAGHRPRALVYCSVTTALLWPRPGAVWLDTPAAENRPGRHGLWQRPVERRRLAQAPAVLVMAHRSLDALSAARPPATLLPVPVAPSGPSPAVRDIDAIAYAGDPVKRRLPFLLEQWARARRAGETLVVAGVERLPAGLPAAGVEPAGRLPREEYRALLRRSRAYLAAPRREDYGIAALEALADGCLLVTTPAPGPYPALDLARRLDPRLVSPELAGAIRIALGDPAPGYAERAQALLEPFSPAAFDAVLRERVLPALLAP